MTMPINTHNKNTQTINNTSLKNNNSKNLFIKYSNELGYIPVIGAFVGIRRIYKTLSSEKTSGIEILRGSLEIAACGPILAIIDGIIYVVKAISNRMKKNKTDQKITAIPSRLNNASKEPQTTTVLKKSTPTPISSLKDQPKDEETKGEESATPPFSSDTLPDIIKSPLTPIEEPKTEENLKEEKPSLEITSEKEIPTTPPQVIDIPKETTLIENIENVWDNFRDNLYGYFSPKKAPTTPVNNLTNASIK